MFVTLLDRLMKPGVAADRRRTEPREAVAVAAELEIDGTRRAIEVGNLSAGGLMAYADVAVTVAARVAVWLDGRRFPGEIRWHSDGRFGMRFDMPFELDQSIIDRYRPAAVEANKVMSRWMI